MPAIRFVHAADLHLDTAFPGLAHDVSADLARNLHEATFTALNRLVDLCETQLPDFLILAGDTYNQEDLSLRAQLAVRDACERLGRRGIRVFLAHGNHDPLSSRLQTLHWPDNVTVFGSTVEAVPVYRPGHDDEVIAVVHGISHSGPRETRNLAAWFQRTDDACPQIGVLHTTLGSADGEVRYAPCSVSDLQASGLDYWALGHIHQHGTVSSEPLSVYPGSAQGLHIGEQGPRGCVLVTLTPEDVDTALDTANHATPDRPKIDAAFEFHPLAPVGWQIFSINLEENLDQDKAVPVSPVPLVSFDAPDAVVPLGPPDSLPRLERLIRERLDAMTATVWPGCETLVVRVRLTGRTALDAELRRLSVQNDLCDLLREGWEGADVRLWIKDLEVETRPLFDRDAAMRREDLLGEVLRRADFWRKDNTTLQARADEALNDLFSRGRSRKALTEPDEEELAELLEEAERLCADFLENN